MEIQSLEKVVDGIRPPTITVDAVENVTCGLHRQCGDLRALAVWGDCRNTGSDTDAYFFELTQFVHQGMDIFGAWCFRVENGLGVVKDFEHLLGGKEGSQGRKVFRIFDPRTDDLGESGKEVGPRSRELIATDESSVLAKSFLDPIMVEDGERNRCLPNPPRTDESDGFQIFSQSNNLFDQLAASKAGPWRRGR